MEQADLITAQNFALRAEAGAPGVKEMLTLTPCDLFEMLEGRTLWLVGDSMTQVQSLGTTFCAFKATGRGDGSTVSVAPLCDF